MSKLKDYQIEIPEGTPDTKQAFIDIIKDHHRIFEDAIMSQYANDVRYTYHGSNLEVTEVEFDKETRSGHFTIEVDVSYYEGCKDKNFSDAEELTVEFTLNERIVEFTLDETIWRVE